MKPQIALTSDQMHKLQSLGLDCSDASMCWINGVLIADCDCNVMTALRAVNAPIPAYTAEDILMKLPPLIDGAWLTIQKVDKRGLLRHYKVTWGIAYMTCEYDSEDTLSAHSTGARKVIMTNDLITGLVDMLEWVITNHPDKIKSYEATNQVSRQDNRQRTLGIWQPDKLWRWHIRYPQPRIRAVGAS